MKPRMIALSAIMAALAWPAAAQQLSPEDQAYLDQLEAELPGTLMNNPIQIELQTFGDDYSAKVVKADIPGEAAYQVRVKSAKRQPWDVSVTGPLIKGVEAGDTVTVAFWARASKPDSQTGKGHLQLRVQQKASPYTGVVETELELTDAWEMHEVSGVSQQGFTADEMSIAFNIGDHRQTLEFGPFYVLNLGQ